MGLRSFALFISLLFLTLVFSVPSKADDAPIRLVQESADQLFAALDEHATRIRSDPAFLYDLVNEMLTPLLDFEGVSRLILAQHWRTASGEQRARFTEAFRNTLVRAYALQLADHADKRVRVIAQRSQTTDRLALVATEIIVGQGRPNIPVTYKLRPVQGQWKVFDVEVEGLSFITNFRTNFGAEIDRHGLEALIVRLERGDESLVEQVIEHAS